MEGDFQFPKLKVEMPATSSAAMNWHSLTWSQESFSSFQQLLFWSAGKWVQDEMTVDIWKMDGSLFFLILILWFDLTFTSVCALIISTRMWLFKKGAFKVLLIFALAVKIHGKQKGRWENQLQKVKAP